MIVYRMRFPDGSSVGTMRMMVFAKPHVEKHPKNQFSLRTQICGARSLEFQEI
jgi:hypothetical protein